MHRVGILILQQILVKDLFLLRIETRFATSRSL